MLYYNIIDLSKGIDDSNLKIMYAMVAIIRRGSVLI